MKLVHILQKSEGLLDFGFLLLYTVFLGVKEVVSYTTLSTHEYTYCKMIPVIN